MANGANGVHLQLREALEDYIIVKRRKKKPTLSLRMTLSA